MYHLVMLEMEIIVNALIRCTKLVAFRNVNAPRQLRTLSVEFVMNLTTLKKTVTVFGENVTRVSKRGDLQNVSNQSRND